MLSDSDQEVWRERISARLQELTEEITSVEGIAARLLEAGCRGGDCGGDCPLYQWIVKAPWFPLLPPGREFWVTKRYVHIVDEEVCVMLPGILTNFIERYDDGEFPMLGLV